MNTDQREADQLVKDMHERIKWRIALEEIASASPSMHNHYSGEHRRCAMCNVFIDTARDALGYQAWPAEARTRK